MTEERDIPNTNEIQMYYHCGLCLEEEKIGDYEVGATVLGIQIWCPRHHCNVMHIDLQGNKFPANTTRMVNDADSH